MVFDESCPTEEFGPNGSILPGEKPRFYEIVHTLLVKMHTLGKIDKGFFLPVGVKLQGITAKPNRWAHTFSPRQRKMKRETWRCFHKTCLTNGDSLLYKLSSRGYPRSKEGSYGDHESEIKKIEGPELCIAGCPFSCSGDLIGA